MDIKRTFDRRGARAEARSSPPCSFNFAAEPQKPQKSPTRLREDGLASYPVRFNLLCPPGPCKTTELQFGKSRQTFFARIGGLGYAFDKLGQ